MRELPKGWDWLTVGELCDLVRGVSFKKSESSTSDVPGTLPIIRAGNLSDRGIDFENDLVWVPAERVSADQRLRQGDIVVATSSGSIKVVGKSVHLRTDWHGAHGAFMSVLRPSSAIDPAFAGWYVRSPTVRALWSDLAKGTNINNLKKGHLEETPIPVPPLPEQRRIVAAIEKCFSRLDVAEASLADALRRTEVFVASHVNSAFEVLGQRVPLGDLAEVNGGIQKQPKRRPVENKFPFLRVANVKRNQLELEDVHEIELFGDEIDRFRLRAGDLLVVEGNGSPEQIGRSAVWGGEIENCVHQNHLIRVRPGPDLDPRFLNVFWNSSTNARQLASVASSTSGLYTLSTSKLKRVVVPVTNMAEQERIANDLDDAFKMADRIRQELVSARQRSTALRRSILAAAFSGRLVPQDSADEPASVLLERITAERASAKPSRRKKAAS